MLITICFCVFIFFILFQDLNVKDVPNFVAKLSETVKNDSNKITNSSATISTIVNILNNIANVSGNVSETVIKDVLNTVDLIIGDNVKHSWEFLNGKNNNASSQLLGSLETLTSGLGDIFSIETHSIILNRTTFNNSFNNNLNSNFSIEIPNTNIFNVFITTVTFPTLYYVMPTRNSTFDISVINNNNTNGNEAVEINNVINAAVVLVKINATIPNVTLSYRKLNSSLSQNPQCVFWNFTLFNDLGAWDDKGCTFVSDENDKVTCHCNHLTSFSILMSTDIPLQFVKVLDVITYIGVGISLASLVICLMIEGCVWKAITRNSTALMRHVSIINTALSLLIADICFIIGAAISKNPSENPEKNYKVPFGPCTTATFFMHFFYLALFFWMLVSALLLFYRTVMIFSHMPKSTMLAIGFSIGYGCPLIIAVITVAVTASGNGYIRENETCWLNWNTTKTLLAFVIPALTIVVINILIVIVVLFRIMRTGVGDTAQRDEKHTLVVIIRCVAILTPLFGLTWSLGVGTMLSPTTLGIHIAFAFFNSLQGFFILVFGTLFDSKIRAILSGQVATPNTSSNITRITSHDISTFRGMDLINWLRGRQYIYHISEAVNSSHSAACESFMHV
ncbi:M-phase phosphoprotein 8 [Sarotherodon galilaeus]